MRSLPFFMRCSTRLRPCDDSASQYAQTRTLHGNKANSFTLNTFRQLVVVQSIADQIAFIITGYFSLRRQLYVATQKRVTQESVCGGEGRSETTAATAAMLTSHRCPAQCD